MNSSQDKPESSTGCAQVSLEEQMQACLDHYEKVTLGREWNNQVPQAIRAWYAAKSAPASSSLALTENDEPLRELCFDYRNAATAHAENYFQRIVRWVKQQEVRSSFAPAATKTTHSDTPRMDATLGKGNDWVFAEGCRLERELAEADRRYDELILAPGDTSSATTFKEAIDAGGKITSIEVRPTTAPTEIPILGSTYRLEKSSMGPWKVKYGDTFVRCLNQFEAGFVDSAIAACVRSATPRAEIEAVAKHFESMPASAKYTGKEAAACLRAWTTAPQPTKCDCPHAADCEEAGECLIAMRASPHSVDMDKANG